MKINPIQITNFNQNIRNIKNIKTVSTPIEEPKTPATDSYGKALVTFKGGPTIPNQYSNVGKLENKLAYVFTKLGNADMVMVSKDVKQAQAALDKFFSEFERPIAKLFVIPDEKLRENLLFTRCGNDIQYTNLSDWQMLVNGFETLEPGDTTYVEEGDHIRTSDGWLKINLEPENDFDYESVQHHFMKEFNLTDDAIKIAKTHNRKLLSTMTVPEKAAESASIGSHFAKVGGQDEVIKALKKNVLFPMRYPEVFEGFMLSRGILLYGPPGTGKTLLAQALAAEAGASAFEQCATEFDSKYVGESEKNCRELFEKAVDAQPSIIVLDEIDALGKSRDTGDIHGDKLLNQFLALMSDLEKRGDNVFVIGTTNREGALDAALTRAGRFDLKLECKAPDLKGTKQILDIKVKGKPVNKNVDLDAIAKKMHAKNMTGADISSVVKDAHVNALERKGIYKDMDSGRFSIAQMDLFTIDAEDFEKAINEIKKEVKNTKPVGYRV